MSIASQIFALFFAVLYGALFTISDRWRPFFIRHGSREGWHRFRLAVVCFGVLPVLYFVIAFGVMLGVHESDWVRLVLAVYSVAPLAAFHFLWSWMVLGNPTKAYSPEERDLEPVKGALAWVGDRPVSAMAVVGLMGIFLLGPILGLVVLRFW